MADVAAIGPGGVLLRADGVSVSFPVPRAAVWQRRRPPFRAVEDVSFAIRPGETLGLVGESGSGKTTLGRALLGHVPLAAGRIHFRDRDITGLNGTALRRMRRYIQPVFQDPYGSLNPRMSVGDLIAEPLIVHGVARGAGAAKRVATLLDLVGLSRDCARRYPDTFSGGQRQRIGIARALAVGPALIVADEPVSALDVSIRAQIVNLFRDLQKELGIAYLFIAHDLAVVRYVSHNIAILYAGRVVEMGARDDVYRRPRHPYTQALLESVPIPDPAMRGRRRAAVRGELTASESDAAGCRFAPRCPIATAICREQRPPLETKDTGHVAACWNG